LIEPLGCRANGIEDAGCDFLKVLKCSRYGDCRATIAARCFDSIFDEMELIGSKLRTKPPLKIVPSLDQRFQIDLKNLVLCKVLR
jgi:hypothetical protein